MHRNNHGPSKPGPFQGLSPERILEMVESELGRACSNLCRSYNSYINRVFEIADTDGNGMVVKFYRPGRWSAVALQDEHDFLLVLAEQEIPVLAPLLLQNGQSLGRIGEMYFAVFPKKGGRLIDEFNDELWLEIGRLLGRMHMVGARKMPRDRVRMHPAHSTASQVEFICRSGLLPADLMPAYTRLTSRLIDVIKPLFDHTEMIRIHGDCHSGNLIYRPGESLYILDFDDMVVGPPVQDVWMLLPGPPEESVVELNLFMEGYETFRPFDHSSLRLIEPLRAMRFIHYCAWCAHQVVEDGETAVIPDFASRTYWQKELDDLEDQLQRIEEPPQSQDFSREIF
ncbi:MAG: serine/threonine protein kinase [Desulfobulbus sp.]